MRSFMVFGVIFGFGIATLVISRSAENIAILKHGQLVKAILVQKPKRYVPTHGSWKGSAIYNYRGITFRKDIAEERAENLLVGDSIEFCYYPRYHGTFLEKWETTAWQYWEMGIGGSIGLLFGSLCLWQLLVGEKRMEERQMKEIRKGLLLPNGKRRNKAKHAHTVLKPLKRRGRS